MLPWPLQRPIPEAHTRGVAQLTQHARLILALLAPSASFLRRCPPRRASLSFAALTYRLTHCGTAAFGMRTYKKVGTDPALLRCYATYQRFCSVLKLDWLLQLELLAFSLLGMQELTWQWWATVGAHAPIALVWPPLGLRSARRESGVLMGVLIVAAVAQPFLYAVQLLTLPPHDDTLPSPSHLSPHRTMMYCTRRLRERTFPFSSVPLDVVYALALLTRLLFLAASLLVRRNFGCGLAAVLHGRGNDSRAAGSSSFSGSGLAPDVFGSGSSSTHGVAAAEHLLPRPLPDHEAASGAALAPGALPSLVLDVMDGGGPVTVPGGESMNGEGQRMSSSSSEPQLHQRLSRVESEESSASTGASGGPPLQRLTIGDGSASTAGAGSPPRSQPGSFS